MALDSQSTRTQAITDVSGLAHEVFTNDVKNHVRAVSAVSQAFQDANVDEEYTLEGTNLVGAALLGYAGGALATSRKLPDHEYVDPKNWKISAKRRYARIARDGLTTARAKGKGAFKDLGGMIFDQLWDRWSRMEIRHSIGDSRGYVALASSRTSATVVVLKDGYGHTGTNPLLHLRPGMALAWLDASASFAVGGAARISSINRSTKTITFASAFDDGVTVIAAGDPIVFATTGSTASDNFDTEYNVAPHGVAEIVNFDGNFTTVHNISESDEPDWKPFIATSSTFDQYEVTELFMQAAAQSMAPVTPQSHALFCQGAVIAELARTLGSTQQQMTLGRKWEGGHQGVIIAGQDFTQDDYFFHDVLVGLCTETLYRADLEEADFYGEDGGMWSRLKDEDADEAYVRQYMNTWSTQRNRHFALKGISLANVNEDLFTPVRS